MINKTVAIFGVFDGIHSGHLYFIKNAKKQGNHLVAIVARDDVVNNLKGHLPKQNEADRVKALLEVKDVDLIVLGDPHIETYNVLKEVKPSIIYIGYDQQNLYESLNKEIKKGNLPEMDVIYGEPYKPEVYHSSFLNES